MKMHKITAALATLAIFAAGMPSAHATSLIYAVDGHGGMGFSMGAGGRGERLAIAGCGGFAKGCKVVMKADGDCMAFAEASSSQGYYYWVGYTTAQNAYARQSEIKRVSDMVMGWCTSNKAGGSLCKVRHATCAGYITNLN